MPTLGQFAAFTERCKDEIVTALRNHLSLLLSTASTHVIKEQPLIEKYGLAGDSPQESFVNVYTALPHRNQRIPHIAVMSSAGTERKMGLGRQVVTTFRDPLTGKPTVREVVGGDMTIIIEIAAVDTNTRSELTDIVFTFFAMYLEEARFSIQGSAETNPETKAQNLHQIILKAQAQISGETEQNRPNGESFDKIYFNRIVVPVIFIDYVDREIYDISVNYSNTLLHQDDFQEKAVTTLPEPGPYQFVVRDDFETLDPITNRWTPWLSPDTSLSRLTDYAAYPTLISGNGSAIIQALNPNLELAALVRPGGSGLTSGKVRAKYNLTNGASAFVLFGMLQGLNPFEDSSYHIVVIPSVNGEYTRIQLVKGPIVSGAIVPIAESSRIQLPIDTDLAVSMEWKSDSIRGWTRIRAHVSMSQTPHFSSLAIRLEYYDRNNAFLTSFGEGWGARPNPAQPGVLGAVVVDDIEIIKDLGSVSTSFSRVRP